MSRPRAADDFPAIRARMDELRLERERALTSSPAGPQPYRNPALDGDREDGRRLPRLIPIRKLVR